MSSTFSNFKRPFYGNEVICAAWNVLVSMQVPKSVIYAEDTGEESQGPVSTLPAKPLTKSERKCPVWAFHIFLAELQSPRRRGVW